MVLFHKRLIAVSGMGLFFVLGCESSPAVPALYPVQGKVIRKGDPVDNGGLLFTDPAVERKGLTYNAQIEPDGSFKARTLQMTLEGTKILPGIPQGEFKVTYHPAGDGQKTGLEVSLEKKIQIKAGATNEFEVILPDELPKGLGSPRDDAPPSVKPPENQPAGKSSEQEKDNEKSQTQEPKTQQQKQINPKSTSSVPDDKPKGK